MAFGVSRKTAGQVVREIDSFLEKQAESPNSACFTSVRTHLSGMKWERTPAPLGPGTGTEKVDPDDVAPSGWGRFREVAWHLPRMLSGLGPLGPRGPEDGPPVLVIPGFFGTDRTTMELRRALARAGWRAHPWLLGVNMGAKKNTLNLLCKRLKDLEDPRKVLVVGWSLGGLFARQLAHRCPDKVRAVVTLGHAFFRRPQDQHQRPRNLRTGRGP